MMSFFYICEYLGVKPSDFFDFEIHNPSELSRLFESMKTLNHEQLAIISAIVNSWKK